MSSRTPEQAIDRAQAQSNAGPRFEPGTCKRQTRILYGVDSDGSRSAAAAWFRTKHRVKVPGSAAPRGALLWWTGGADGFGHVAISDGKGGVWSVDILRPGYWDHVRFNVIGSKWPRLAFAGVSLDIDGVRVVAEPLAAPAARPGESSRITAVRNLLNEDRVIDLDLLDEIVKAGRPRAVAAAAKSAKWAAVNAVRTLLKVAGR